jgi:hypothetical protein
METRNGLGRTLRIVTLLAVFTMVCIAAAPASAAPNFMVNAATGASDAFYSVAVIPQGGYVVGGKTDPDATVSKFNEYGFLEWSKSFTGVQTSNCNTVAAGEAGIFLTGRLDSTTLWVAKLARWGEVLWQNTYVYNPYASTNLAGISAAATQDGGCALSLRIKVDDTANYDQGLIKIASDGTLEWMKAYGLDQYDFAGQIIETRDATGAADGYLLATAEDMWGGVDNDNEVILIKTDLNGAILWAYAYAGLNQEDPATAAGNEFVKGITQTADLGYAIVGNSYSASDPGWDNRRTPYLLKVDSTGGTAWAKRFGVLTVDPGGNAFTYGDVAEAENNTDLILAGHSQENRFWLLRFDATGTLLNEGLYPASTGTNYSQLGSVEATSDGGAVASRWSKDYGAGDYDAFLMKFDASLSFPLTDCPEAEDPESEVTDMTFDRQDVSSFCHSFDLTDWTVTEDASVAYDPDMALIYCAEDGDVDSDGVEDHLDNCVDTANPAPQVDADGDGWGDACDCDDTNPVVNPGADEIMYNGIDDDCDPTTLDDDPVTDWTAAAPANASVHGEAAAGSLAANYMAFLMIPLATVFFVRICRRRG